MPENKEFNQALRGGLDRALVQSRAASQAVTGMVSQGWTSSQAAHYMTTFPGMTTTFTRADWSLTLRALESYADDLWKGLGKGLPSKLYRGGAVNGTGLSSWTAKRTTADAYHMRNGGVVYEMDVPGKLLGYKLRSNAGQEEYLALGTPRVTEVMGSVERGVLDGRVA